ncbi:MAG TPA: SDR family NAD(P)-dependent oxidoreductase [Aggregatilineales bacterium]|nr:SDR family NAD(P)-dependent oxidoreductase [Anaerolineales bacterium]HRE48512.1 SDR family NAD(P)-dependent oxidoreductase [Aggregatilineales bacterium]
MTSRITSITPAAVFLVSGGGRGITATCVIRMAEQYRCAFILLGRSDISAPEPAFAAGISDDAGLKKAIMAAISAAGEKPTPALIQKQFNAITARREIIATLEAIQAAGGRALYYSADVTDPASIRTAVSSAESQLGTVSGILHGAGNLADKRIEQKTEKDYETVYAAKVRGLENMLAAVSLSALRHVVLFSSVAGFFGNAGQADYALANEVLNKTAYRLRHDAPECRVLAVDWGPWEGGMVSPALKQFFAQNNITLIPERAGADMLIEELDLGTGADAQIVIGSGIALPPPALTDTPLQSYQVKRAIRLEDNPFLCDHVVNGNAVLPMVCAISWVANTIEGLYPGYRFYGYKSYKVLKGIVFDETLAPEYTLELRETSKDAERITFEAKISSRTAEGKLRYHYQVDPILLRERPPAPVFSRMDLENRANIAGLPLYETKIVFHGWSFRGVQTVLNMDTTRTTMACYLDPVPLPYQGQFPVGAFNHYAVDVALQSLGIFARLTYEMGSLPLATGESRVYRDIPFGIPFYVTLEPTKITETNVTCNLNIHDEQGVIYIAVDASEITLNKRLIEMFFKNTLPAPIQPAPFVNRPPLT